MKKQSLFLVLFAQIFYLINGYAQQISFVPVNYKPDQNVSGFNGITQDQMGYIWLSSYKGGISRYDGLGFVNFQHNDSDSNSLAGNWTYCILADSSDKIWIGTYGQGLDCYDQITNIFTHFRHDNRRASSLGNDTVTAILEDHNGNLWIGNHGGLDLFNRKTGVFTHYSHRQNDTTSLTGNQISIIYEDHQGTLWVGCEIPGIFRDRPLEGGLNRFNKKDGSFKRYQHDPKDSNSLEANEVQSLFEDSKGNFWVGSSGNGLHILDRNTGNFKHFHYDSTHPENLSRPPCNRITSPYDYISFINEDVSGGIWIGSDGGGINRYDPVLKKISHFGSLGPSMRPLTSLKNDTSSGFAGCSTAKALFSADGQIWITTYASIFSETLLYNATTARIRFPFYPIQTMKSSNTFYCDNDTILWIGTDGGLIKKNLQLQTESYYKIDPKANGLGKNSINVIRINKDENNLWVGTMGGLYKFSPQTNRFTKYHLNSGNESGLSNDSIWSMSLDHQGDLWVGTLHGLNKLNKNTGGFTHYIPDNKAGFDYGNTINCLREDQHNIMWIGTEYGLYTLNIANGELTTILAKARVRSICVDSKNVVWIGADTSRSLEQELYWFDRNRNQFILYVDPISQERVNNLFDIMEDDKMNLWVSTKSALLKINEKRDVLRKYGTGFGVQENKFEMADNFKSKKGKLFFGDLHGYYSFFPDELKDIPSRLNLTSFKIKSKEVVPLQEGVLEKAIWHTNQIKLAYNQNSFSFEFSEINYQSPGNVKYLFMLENYDDSWLTYGAEHRAYYFNMPPGRYVFHVKAIDAVGRINEKSIPITILPPWWKTLWAYLLFGLLAVCAIWGIIYYRSKKLKEENKLLEQKVNERTNQLKLSFEELKTAQSQLIQSEKMASLGVLTAGIAHEIQNPLNFVNNFSEVNTDLIDELQSELKTGNMESALSISNDVRANEQKINHHGKRADAIVKNMLQHSRTGTGTKEQTDINALADEYLRISYQGFRSKDKFFNAHINTDFDRNIGKINIIPQDIGRVLLNLYNNAFYAVAEKKKEHNEGYEPAVSVSSAKMDGKIEIKVTDNGIGISQKILDKIFQPFFTTKPTGQGTGLGLSLSYDIIEAHGGIIKIDSLEGNYTRFSVILNA